MLGESGDFWNGTADGDFPIDLRRAVSPFHLLFQPRSMLKWESAHPLRGFERWGMSPKKSRGSKSEEWRLLEPTDLRLFLEALTKTILKWGLVRSCEVSIDVWSERLGEFSSIFDGRVVL